MEGDPHPGAARGRMSLQSFNPSVDVSVKINKEIKKLQQPAAETNISRTQSGNESFRENNSTTEGSERVNGNVKRKQSEVNCEDQYPNKSPKNDDDDDDNHSAPENSFGSFRKPNVDKLDWNVLRSSKAKQKKMSSLDMWIAYKKLVLVP
ncbi:LOW QUALITY PROTEIN: uncharacterized protein LOC130946292 [Arachis stenosperma]|uniref:LOW QUALITY PROTEIN: uncharacterized protein LOC130946292 n=1 Tax=Arachis stenosperma TaxID=217475 RepID=UPI0025AC008D|nr:LOW QUALITY PROTEIN: uncharacterized protein LOC130946292 [Arachis stenosperma]